MECLSHVNHFENYNEECLNSDINSFGKDVVLKEMLKRFAQQNNICFDLSNYFVLPENEVGELEPISQKTKIYNKSTFDSYEWDQPADSDYFLIGKEIMQQLVEFVSDKHVSLSKISEDGRVNSSFAETDILKQVEVFIKTVAINGVDHLRLHIPKMRYWYDFSITAECNNKEMFYPVNVKISSLKSADNCSSKEGVYWALTGTNPETIKKDWESYSKSLSENLGRNVDADYFYLIINKDKTNDVFYASLKHLKELTPNANNFPFQCKWNKNRNFIRRTFRESKNFVLTAMAESIERDTKNKSFEKYLKPELEVLYDA